MSKNDIYKNPHLQRAFGIETKDQAQEVYQDWATSYEDTMLQELGYTSHESVAEILLKSNLKIDAKILDLGCGTGLVGKALAKRGFTNIDGADISEPMLKEAEKEGVYKGLHIVDLTTTTAIPSGSYDAATAAGVFTHGHLGAECLDEVFRMLKPKGLLACAVREQVWDDMGFGARMKQFEESEALRTLYKENLANYEGSENRDGVYLVVQKI